MGGTDLEELKPCPFCGNPPEGYKDYEKIIVHKRIEKTNLYNLPQEPRNTYFVGCPHCGAMGGLGVAGYMPLIKRTITDEDAIRRAVEKWNSRA